MTDVGSGAVAIIGASGRFPGASSVDALWGNLLAGRISIAGVSEADLAAAGPDGEAGRHPDYVRAASVIDGIELFDADYFGLSPREAALMDPQHRVFLHCVREVLDAAGCDPARFPGTIGLYAGCSLSSYLLANLLPHRRWLEEVGAFAVALANDKDYLTARAAYHFDLRGPCVGVQSACSTSLVAVHMACQSLLAGECDLALAGGITIRVPQRVGYLFRPGSILSPDGRCRPFDAEARGTVLGNGAGLVALRRLEDARADRDPIIAVILGSAVVNEGALKAGLTAPSVAGQTRVIVEAMAVAGVEPADIGYVEAHGTGTSLGDPVEAQALADAFRRGPPPAEACLLGSVKANLGHLDVAAGVAGLIKAALAVRDGIVPPHPAYDAPNPKLAALLAPTPGAPFRINRTPRRWAGAGAAPRRAGVSSFGIGGSNAHVVLEAPPAPAAGRGARPVQVITWSAASPGALAAVTADLGADLAKHGEADLADLAFTLNTGRPQLPWRRMAVVSGRAAALEAVRNAETSPPSPARAAAGVALLFPGQGTLRPGSATALYRDEPDFRAALDGVREALEPCMGQDPLRVLQTGDAERLNDTALAQPLLFAVEYALGRVLIDRLGPPALLLGHSLGEFTAACLAGVMALPDAARLLTSRGRLMAALPRGAMLAVSASHEALASRTALDVAAVNGPGLCVLSGPAAAVGAFESANPDLACRRLSTSHAFHSSMMDPVLPELAALLDRVPLRAPSLPMISGLTGRRLDEEALSPTYWLRLTRETVRFDLALDALALTGALAIEVGPGRTLGILAGRHPDFADRPVVSCLPDAPDESRGLATALGEAWLAGCRVDWGGRDEGRRRLSLSPYPFQGRRCWIDPPDRAGPAAADAASAPEPAPDPVPEPATAPEGGTQRRPAGLPPAVAPRSDAERMVVDVWESVFGVAPIGVHDDFFALGGHSLLAVQAVSRLRAILPVALPLDLFFEARTAAILAQRIEARLAAHLDAMTEDEAAEALAALNHAPVREDVET